MKRNISIAIGTGAAIILISAVTVYVAYKPAPPTNQVPVNNQPPANEASNTPGVQGNAGLNPASQIHVTSLQPDSVVISPLTITGEARGGWYFEASFPVVLQDSNGRVIAQTTAQAKGNWMTNDFVPFEATLNFAQPATATGTLILKNDNPSGNPQFASQLEIPVKFK